MRRTSSSSSSSRRATTTRIPRCSRRDRRELPHRCHAPQPVRRVEGGGRSARPGVRALLRHAHRVLPGRLPHRLEPCERRAARLSRVSRGAAFARAARTASTATRASRSGTTSTRRTSVLRRSHSRRSPRPGAVYNIGGGRENSVSMLEAIARLEELTGQKLEVEYVDEPRRGDHICYISDLGCLKATIRTGSQGVARGDPRRSAREPR